MTTRELILKRIGFQIEEATKLIRMNCNHDYTEQAKGAIGDLEILREFIEASIPNEPEPMGKPAIGYMRKGFDENRLAIEDVYFSRADAERAFRNIVVEITQVEIREVQNG